MEISLSVARVIIMLFPTCFHTRNFGEYLNSNIMDLQPRQWRGICTYDLQILDDSLYYKMSIDLLPTRLK